MSIVALASGESLVLTNDNFDQHVMDPTKNVLVEFYAPCKYISFAKYSAFLCVFVVKENCTSISIMQSGILNDFSTRVVCL